VEAGHVREQHQQPGLEHRGDEGGEVVVVAVRQLVGRDGVVLVDDRDRPEVEQPLERGAGVEVAAAADEVVLGEQDLTGREPGPFEHALVGLDELALADRGAGLQRRQVDRPALEAEQPHARGDGPGGDQHQPRPGRRGPSTSCSASWVTWARSSRPSAPRSDDEPTLTTASSGRVKRAVTARPRRRPRPTARRGSSSSGAPSSCSGSSSWSSSSPARMASRSSAGRSSRFGSKSNTSWPMSTSSPSRAPASMSAASTPARRSRPCR
jgi:hypothetical protein